MIQQLLLQNATARAWSEWRQATEWTVGNRNLVRARFCIAVQSGPEVQATCYKMDNFAHALGKAPTSAKVEKRVSHTSIIL